MKYPFRHTVLWLCLGCLLSVNLKPLFFHSPPKTPAKAQRVVVDVHNDSLPSDGKEQKTEWLKNIAKPFLPAILLEEEVIARKFLAFKLRTAKQVFLPIILPPPKAVA